MLPGIGPALTIALLLPVTLQLRRPTGAFIMFAGIYYGGMYGGSTTSILLNTPGETGSVATALEGYQMAQTRPGGAALATAAIGSFVAGTIGTLALTFLARPIAELAVRLPAGGLLRADGAGVRRRHRRSSAARWCAAVSRCSSACSSA